MDSQVEINQDLESLLGDEDLRDASKPEVPSPANPVHETLLRDGFSQDKDVGLRSTASRVWKEGFFTMWVKAKPAGGKPFRYAVCECNPGKCKE